MGLTGLPEPDTDLRNGEADADADGNGDGDGEGDEGDVVVLPGDTPLLRAPTLAALVRHHRQHDAGATLLTAVVDDPTGYGRCRARPRRI